MWNNTRTDDVDAVWSRCRRRRRRLKLYYCYLSRQPFVSVSELLWLCDCVRLCMYTWLMSHSMRERNPMALNDEFVVKCRCIVQFWYFQFFLVSLSLISFSLRLLQRISIMNDDNEKINYEMKWKQLCVCVCVLCVRSYGSARDYTIEKYRGKTRYVHLCGVLVYYTRFSATTDNECRTK